MEWLKENFKCITTVIGGTLLVLSLFTAILSIDARWVKHGELQAMEEKVVRTLGDFQKQQKIINQEQRYQVLSDQIQTQKQLIKKYPNDPELKEDLEVIKQERDKVKDELNKTR